MKKTVEPKTGKDHRHRVSRGDQAHWDAERRKLSVQALMKAAEKDRTPALLPLKRERMAASAFGFFRGAAPIMAYDLSLMPHTGILTQLCGDAHVQNLGAYEGVDGKLIFDINDFDETVVGPFEWDVKRMATSVVLAGQTKLSNGDCHEAAQVCITAYCTLMRKLSRMPVLDVARYTVRRLNAATPIAKMLSKAERASPLRLRDKLTEEHAHGRQFRRTPPELRRATSEEKKAVLAALPRYRASLLPERQHFFDQFRAVDVGFKVVGTGSVGLRDYVVYMEGNGADDPLFLQVKQEVASAWSPYLRSGKSSKKQNGQRVAEGQRAMQLQSDPMLGWTRFGGYDYLVRQLNDHKATLDVTALKAEALTEYAFVCGEMLARGHARAGSARLISEYIGGGAVFAEAVVAFASAYAKQTQTDWKHFAKK